MTVKPLEIKQLYRSCDAELLPFKTTSELKPLDAPLGQERAMAAIDFGINVDFDGYNIFCVGPEGTGKTNLIKRQITKKAKQIPAPDDWCYINNFESPHKPKALRLPAGNGLAFAHVFRPRTHFTHARHDFINHYRRSQKGIGKNPALPAQRL